MTPFFLSAFIAAVSFFWLLMRSSDPKRGADAISSMGEGDSSESVPSKKTCAGRRPIDPQALLFGSLAFLLALVFVALIEYVLFAFHAPYVLGRIDQMIVIFQSPAMRRIFLGAIFGVIFGYWTHAIVMRAARGGVENEKPESFTGDLFVWVSLLLVFLVGVIDADMLTKIARFGGNVKLPGGVELSLGNKDDGRADTSFAQIVPPVSSQASTYAAPNASSGLDNLAELSEAARRDGLFLALKRRMAGKESGNAVSNALKNCGDNGIVDEPICIIGKHINSLNTFYGKIGECLKAYVKRYQDDRDAAEALMPIAKILIIKLMPSAADSDNKAVMRIRDNIIGIYNSYCNNKQIGTLGGELSDTYIVEHFAKAENLAAPYHWNAVAAILAYNRKYAAAINILDSWLARYRGGLSSNAHSAEAREQLMEVYEIRVRSMIAGYIYEWLNSEPNVKTKALLDYHANNLNSAIKILQESITNIISPWSGATSENISVNRICDGGHFLREFKWRITVVDQLGPESRKYVGVNQLNVWRMALSYTSTLISLKQTWIDVVLSSEDYQNLYAFDAQKYANELKEIDTDCMKVINPVDGSNGEYYANLLKAENLYWYARVTRANALAPNEPDMRRERLQDALGAAREGLARIAWRAEQQRLERREDRRKAEPCYDRVTAADASANGNEAVRMAHSKLRTPIAEAVSKECRNEFAFKISGTEEIRDVERLSEIIRQLNADLN